MSFTILSVESCTIILYDCPLAVIHECNIFVLQLEVSAGLSLIANYFNENISEWEPLIEPVEESTQKYRQWELSMEV